MIDWRNWFVIVFALVLGYLWYRYSRTYHNQIREGDEVCLHPYLQYVFGKPNGNGVYNIRGVYNQLFISELVVASVFYNLKLISLLQFYQLFMVAVFSFPALELFRHLRKRIK